MIVQQGECSQNMLSEGIFDEYFQLGSRRNIRPVKNGIKAAKQAQTHTSSTAFGHLPPNSARFSYATEGALFISAQLSSDAISALRKVRVLI